MQIVVEFALIDELWMIGVNRLDFYCNLKVSFGVDGLVNLPEGTLINFFDNFKVLSNFFQHLRHD